LSEYIAVSLCLFPECLSEVKYVTFLPKQTKQLLLYLWRCDIIPQRKLLSSLVRRAYEPSEGQALPRKAMATLRRSNCRSEEHSISSFSRQAENIFSSTSHTTWIN